MCGNFSFSFTETFLRRRFNSLLLCNNAACVTKKVFNQQIKIRCEKKSCKKILPTSIFVSIF